VQGCSVTTCVFYNFLLYFRGFLKGIVMGLPTDIIEKRLDALRQARVDSQIEGQRAHPDDAKLLDAFARGEIDGDEVTRRIIARASAKTTRQKTAA
jgi:Antitoxin VbhA